MKGCAAVAGRLQTPLRGPAAVNATRWAVWRVLAGSGLPLEAGTAARTKWNRAQRGLAHGPATDAACVGASTPAALRWAGRMVHAISALGRGRYQRMNTDAHGFPRGYLMRGKSVHGLRSGNLVEAAVRIRPRRTDVPTWLWPIPTFLMVDVIVWASVVVRARGAFQVGPVDGVPWPSVRLLQRADGYRYDTRPEAPPAVQ